MPDDKTFSTWPARTTAVVMALLGLAELVGGGWLLALGGSPY